MHSHSASEQSILVMIEHDYGPDCEDDRYWDEKLIPNDDIHIIEIQIDNEKLNYDVNYVKLIQSQLEVYDPNGNTIAFHEVQNALEMHTSGWCSCCDFGDEEDEGFDGV